MNTDLPQSQNISSNVKNNLTRGVKVIIGIVISLIVIVFVMLVLFALKSEKKLPVKNVATTKDLDSSDLVFADGKDLAPYSKKFANSILLKERSLDPSLGYVALVNGIGNPSYTFSFLYDTKWGTIKRTVSNLILNDRKKTVSYGLLSWDKNTVQYKSFTCEDLVKDMYKEADVADYLNILSNKYVTVNGNRWNRVKYEVNLQSGVKLLGVDQCLKKSDILLDHFIIAKDANWSVSRSEYMKLMNDILISPTAVKW